MTTDRPTLILVVEDEALVRMLVSDILTEEGGYRVIEAVNAEEALTLLEARDDVRLVFTDVDMPGPLNGFALARIVAEQFAGLKVIVTSGRTTPDMEDPPAAIPFLPKPYAPSVLIRLVRDALGETAEPIVRPRPDQAAAAPGFSVLPTAIKIDQLHTGLGVAGGLAQPLPEPEG
ncbi:response regulator [Microvirga lotononidis]|uniref:Response regulator with CheY-like receiver, AAA-type ATPase, and DNA-binding domains n=1 Tax=Microvirga lotononidis TaxID=864069 RepID=I4Z4P0_9HYPH|nr:response regulator [Microvirga lotononidis]EIM31182.1 response regulator with CheY-like receiver, AAA-type ATPase, and DNA-binding domains [Microvirga lotononidis]WQO30427.1 response regulator [Microvirga lotononidis]